MDSSLFEENPDGLQIEPSSQTSHRSPSNSKAFRSGMMVCFYSTCHGNINIL